MLTPDPPAAAPKRIQRKRTKGWRMPVGAIYVGRPTVWGNPYRVGTRPWPNARPLTASRALLMYRGWLVDQFFRAQHSEGPRKWDLESLRGKDLACWCALDQPCHADVLLELANAKA